MLTSFKRIIEAGFISFSRNMGLSIAQILIIIMVIFLITFLYTFNKASGILISSIQEKVDISVYFKKDAMQEDIFSLKSEITKLPEVKNVEYTSRDQALEQFMERHRGDAVLMDSLKEVGENPFLASLNIRARQAFQYDSIQKFLGQSSYNNLIDKVDYFQRKPVIDKVFFITNSVNRGVIIFGFILVVLAFLVALNTIRIAIFNSKDEISTMRLVGASNLFIRGPFLVQGIITGFLAAAISFLAALLISFFIDSKIRLIAPEIKPFELFFNNFWSLLFLQMLVGIGLGVLASIAGIRRYLNV